MGLEDRVRLKAAEIILDRGVRLKLTAPVFFRLLRLHHIKVKRLRAGTILEFSRVVVANKLDEAMQLKDFKALEKQIEPCVRCIAISMLNRSWLIQHWSKWLARRLLWRFEAKELLNAFYLIYEMNQAADFTTTTKYYCQMAQTMTTANLGQNQRE